MNYIDCLKQQAISFTPLILASIASYGISCKFGWRETIVLTPDYVVSIMSFSLTYIFVGAYFKSRK